MKTLETVAAPSAAPLSPAQRDQLLVEWATAKEALDEAKTAERFLRDKIVLESGLFDPDKIEGTQRVQLGNGWQVKAVKSLDYKLENKHGETFEALKKLSELSPEGRRMSEELCSFEARLRKSEYLKLRGDEKSIIDAILTTKPGAPTLELIPPK